MPFNGAGTFNRLYSWVQDAINGIKIRADRMDNETNGIATGLSDCVTRDGQSPWLANLPANGFKIVNLLAGSGAGDSLSYGQDLASLTRLGIGMVPTNILDITQSQNSDSTMKLLNASTAAGARSVMILANNLGSASSVIQTGGNYTTSGAIRQDGTLFYGSGAGGVTVSTGASQPIYFGINLTEKMRIDTNGRLLIGSTVSNNYQLEVNSSAGGAGGFFFPTGLVGIDVICTGFNNQVYERFFVSPGGVQTQTGSISTNGTSTGYNTSSDSRLKNNITNAPEAGAVIDALQVRSWDWKSNGTHEAYGFVAQEENAVAPFAVTPGDNDPDTITEQWTRDDSKLVPLLVKEIQSLRARVAALEAR